jgi:ribonuclease T1
MNLRVFLGMLVCVLTWAPAVAALDHAGSRPSAPAVIAASELPKEGRDTLALIRKGGPFPYPAKDGSTFSNRERILPKQARGYYKEYTVKTPGVRDRGARRIVCGGKAQTECWYTDDHYKSFKLIKE